MAVTYDECKAMKSAAEAKPQLAVNYAMQLRYRCALTRCARRSKPERSAVPSTSSSSSSAVTGTAADVWQYDDPKLGKVNWALQSRRQRRDTQRKSCHFLDLMNWMAGATPAKVVCDGGIARYKDGRDTWDHANLTAEYPDGSKAAHTLCMFGPSAWISRSSAMKPPSHRRRRPRRQ
jgi:predicted dehydrogenase